MRAIQRPAKKLGPGGRCRYDSLDMADNKDDETAADASEGPDSAAEIPEKENAAVEPRRGALRTLVAAGSALYAGALAVPALRYLASTGADNASGSERWVRVAPLSSLPEKTPTRAQISGDERDAFTVTRDKTLGSVWLQRDGNSVTALSAECPHLGCAIDLSDSDTFGCPCHTSRFSLAGKAESGPSPRAMDRLNTRIKEGWVEVDFRRYRQGVSDQVEVA